MSEGHERLYARHAKRGFDVVFATLVILAGALPAAVLSIWIKLDSRGPVFYRQERVGRNGRPFHMFKFRSMVVGAEHKGAGILVEKNDPRVTRVGNLLRRTSLDELPQILNILVGEMSVIGPRPGLDYQLAKYTPDQRRRLLVRPGVTGWAQVHGRNAIPWDERIRFDLEYVERVTLAMDVRILLRTVRVVSSGGDRIAAKDYFKEKAGGTDGDSSQSG